MTTTPTYWTSVAVRLAHDVTTPDDITFPAGTVVQVQGFIWDNTTWVNGVARPTMHGGGIHVDSAMLPNTDIVHRVIVHGGYVADGDVIRSMLGRR